jgi:endonuclease/exonuclease/phosphatase family metal-dependent hydrolase
MAFTVVSYNVLATAYIEPERYPFSPPELLDPLHRIPALVEHLVRLRADLVCLQEVEDTTFSVLMQRLSGLGFSGTLSRKGRNKPDGCATFFRKSVFKLVQDVRYAYQDAEPGQAPSGHVAQFLVLRVGERLLGVANTHLKWDPPGTPRAQQAGYRQLEQLLGALGRVTPACSGWIITGDLNAAAESDVVALLQASGFAFTHAGQPGAATCNSNGRAKLIDFIFIDRALESTPTPLPRVDDETPLPGPDQPSDHVAVRARVSFRDG